MPSKQSREEWIKKFRNVHGDRWIYTETDTDNRDEKGRIKVICREHGAFWIKPRNHYSLKQGCPKCNGGVRSNTDDFIRKSKDMYGDGTIIYDEVVYVNNTTKVRLICPIHGLFEVTPSNHLNPTLRVGCPYCSNRIHIESIFNELKEKYDNILHTITGYYYNKECKRYYIKVNCKLHGDFEIRLDHILNKHKDICDKCNIMHTKQSKEVEDAIYKEENDTRCLDRYDFIWKSIQKYGLYKFDYTNVNYIDINTDVNLHCNIHNINFTTKPCLHIGRIGYDCPICCNRKRISDTEDWINRKVPKELMEMYDFSEAEYKGNNIPVKLICKEHGEFWRLPHFINTGRILCLKCSNSFYEKEFISLFEKNNIKYEYQKRFEWLGLQSIDFYISSLNIGIECQGSQHFIPSPKFGGEEQLKINIERDKRKKQLCKENNLQLVYYLDKKYNSHMEEDDIFFNKKEDLLKYIQLKFDNIIKK